MPVRKAAYSRCSNSVADNRKAIYAIKRRDNFPPFFCVQLDLSNYGLNSRKTFDCRPIMSVKCHFVFAAALFLFLDGGIAAQETSEALKNPYEGREDLV